MAVLKQLRQRLKSVKSTEKITKAMQMVAASKLKKIKPHLTEAQNYLNASNNLLSNILAQENFDLTNQQLYLQNLFTNKGSNKLLLIIFTSQRGLCGGFNTTIVRKLKADIEQYESLGKEIKLIVVGKKGYDLLKKNYGNKIKFYNKEIKEYPEAIVDSTAEQIMELMKQNEAHEGIVYFNLYKNPLVQILTKLPIFPIISNNLQPKNENIVNKQFIIEGENLLELSIKYYLKAHLKYAQINTQAGEEGARTNAMEQASRNASQITQNLILKINRSRQEIITRELIEIISGADALAN